MGIASFAKEFVFLKLCNIVQLNHATKSLQTVHDCKFEGFGTWYRPVVLFSDRNGGCNPFIGSWLQMFILATFPRLDWRDAREEGKPGSQVAAWRGKVCSLKPCTGKNKTTVSFVNKKDEEKPQES